MYWDANSRKEPESKRQRRKVGGTKGFFLSRSTIIWVHTLFKFFMSELLSLAVYAFIINVSLWKAPAEGLCEISQLPVTCVTCSCPREQQLPSLPDSPVTPPPLRSLLWASGSPLCLAVVPPSLKYTGERGSQYYNQLSHDRKLSWERFLEHIKQ